MDPCSSSLCCLRVNCTYSFLKIISFFFQCKKVFLLKHRDRTCGQLLYIKVNNTTGPIVKKLIPGISLNPFLQAITSKIFGYFFWYSPSYFLLAFLVILKMIISIRQYILTSAMEDEESACALPFTHARSCLGK